MTPAQYEEPLVESSSRPARSAKELLLVGFLLGLFAGFLRPNIGPSSMLAKAAEDIREGTALKNVYGFEPAPRRRWTSLDAVPEPLQQEMRLATGTPLHAAASRGDVAEARALLEAAPRTPRLLAKDAGGFTPLHVAAVYGQEAVARALLGAAPETLQHQMLLAKDATLGFTPLHVAAQEGQEAVARALLGAAPETLQHQMLLAKTATSGRTPLHYAAEKGQEAVARALLGAAPETLQHQMLLAMDADGLKPLNLAVQCGQEAMTRALLSAAPEALQHEIQELKLRGNK